MFELAQLWGTRELALHEAAPLTGALVIAEIFYKFHSFTLEAAAFLGTWYVLSAVRARFWPGRASNEGIERINRYHASGDPATFTTESASPPNCPRSSSEDR
jgi:hypothetical protein